MSRPSEIVEAPYSCPWPWQPPHQLLCDIRGTTLNVHSLTEFTLSSPPNFIHYSASLVHQVGLPYKLFFVLYLTQLFFTKVITHDHNLLDILAPRILFTLWHLSPRSTAPPVSAAMLTDPEASKKHLTNDTPISSHSEPSSLLPARRGIDPPHSKLSFGNFSRASNHTATGKG